LASKKRKKNPLEYHKEARKIDKVKKQHRRTKADRKPRQRQWNEFDELDGGFERIMPRDEQERRQRVIEAADTAQETIDDDFSMESQSDDLIGQVVEAASGLCRVRLGEETILCSLRAGLHDDTYAYMQAVTVGDRVTITDMGEGRGRVEMVQPRRNVIARPDPNAPQLQLLIAANIDQLLIVQAWRNPNIWYELIDRYLITAERSSIHPIICVNKIDLSDDIAHINAELAPYRAIGYEVLLTSAQDGLGMDALRDKLRGKITAVAGLSGVGKSSLLSAIQPGFELRAGAVNEDRGQGRHTTTQTTMLPFDDGYVIDTPGIREFGLYGLAERDLDDYYPEIAAAASACKFADCSHTHEPGCAVQQECETGGISEIRFHSYNVIRAELAEG
jgi:ribosome biogenesis GTPase